MVSPWLAAGVVFLVLFVVIGFASERALFQPPIGAYHSLGQLYVRVYSVPIFNGVMGEIPILGALAMLWACLARPQRNDGFLWSATMTFTAIAASTIATELFFGRASSIRATHLLHTYPNSHAVVGMVTFMSWILLAYRSDLSTQLKGSLLAISVLSLLLVPAYLIANPFVRPIDIAGSACFSGALLALGVFVASRIGANLPWAHALSTADANGTQRS